MHIHFKQHFLIPTFFLYLFICSLVFADESSSSQVTFSVDLRDTLNSSNLAIDELGIRGNTAPLSWDKSFNMTDENGDGIYAAEVTFNQPVGTLVEFKYALQGGLIWEQGEAQKLTLTGENLNVKVSPDFAERSLNPFQRYVGNWGFDQAGLSMVWDQKTVTTRSLRGQKTTCNMVNTDRSILCVVTNKQDPNWTLGHMFWAYNSDSNEVHWVSHFFPDRLGVGTGTIDEQGNMTVKVKFQGEPQDTYRVYQWRWDSEDSYTMMSRQHTQQGELTGNWYGGRFIRPK